MLPEVIANGGDGRPPCPLCGLARTARFAVVGERSYRKCPRCRLVFVPAEQRLDAAAERARYDTHQNEPEDERYRAFLARLVDPLSRVLEPGDEGLDFGSGPGPTLSLMMRERGFTCADYDPFYAPDPAPLSRDYDFVASTEVIEHLYHPRGEFERLHRLLRPGGWLGLMTEILAPDQSFAEWWYIRDPSHVCFYSEVTMQWIADHFGYEMLCGPHRNVVLLRKSTD